MRLPASLVRLQRRQAYRVRLPSSMHAQCRVARDAPRDALELQIIDLSVGGIAMACNAADWQAQIGEHLAGCRIGLPDAHGFDVELEVRNVTPLRDGKSRVRVGCQFVNLPGATAADVQRLILHVERATHR
jgi:c-di-GMP-binding flagellar brake protein YcgR